VLWHAAEHTCNTHEDSMRPLACLQKARWKLNLDIVDRSEDQARVSQNPISDVQVGQDRGVGMGETGNALRTSIHVVSKVTCRKYFSY